MLSRARIFAAVAFLASCLAGPAAWAQVQNLEAGKSASQLFAGTCNACHKSPRGLLKTVSPGALPGFLREHYTTSSDMASQLASFLISNGANDARAKPGADKPGVADQTDRQGRKNRNAPSQEATRPDDGPPPGEGERQVRKRLVRPQEPSEEAKPSASSTPAQSAIERGPDGRRLKRLGKPRPGAEEPSMANEPPRVEPGEDDKAKGDTTAKGEPAKEDVGKKEDMGNSGRAKSDAAKSDAAKSDAAKSDAEGKSNEAKSEPAKMDAPKDNASGEKSAVSRDPVPPVTPAPPAAASSVPTPVPAVASGGSSESAAPAPRASAPQAPAPQEPPAVTASTPPPAPPSSGPPAPPISR